MRVPFILFFGFSSVLLYYMAFIFLGRGIHEFQMGEQFSMTAAKFLPNISWLGMYPTWETFIGQAILFAAFIFALVYTFIIKPKKEVLIIINKFFCFIDQITWKLRKLFFTSYSSILHNVMI